jgi:hypothetical protein
MRQGSSSSVYIVRFGVGNDAHIDPLESSSLALKRKRNLEVSFGWLHARLVLFSRKCLPVRAASKGTALRMTR